MGASISPSILSADFGALREAAVEAERAGASSIHIDIMDGHYVHNFSFGIDLVPALKRYLAIPIVVHLEIENPDTFVDDFSRAGADLIVVQEDTCPNLPYTIDAIKRSGVRAGVGINPDRTFIKIEAHPHLLKEIDLLIVMGVYPGFGGQRFAETAIPNVRRARTLRDAAGASFDIAVDGGVNTDTAPRIVEAGGSCLIAGSSVFGTGSIDENIRRLHSSVYTSQ